jgi:hypothetical protein
MRPLLTSVALALAMGWCGGDDEAGTNVASRWLVLRARR